MGTAPGTTWSSARALSQDGSIGAGYSAHSPFPPAFPGFTWTAPGGRSDFGLEPGMPLQSPAYGLSSDGSTVVGYTSDIIAPALAYRRVGTGPLQYLGSAGYERSYARAVSGDGSVVVGHGESGSGGSVTGQAFRWTEAGGMQGLGWLPQLGPYSEAVAISRDASTIVGDSGVVNTEAFVWRQSTGMQALPPLPGGTTAFSTARGVSADGSVIVGDAEGPELQHHPVRWTTVGAEDLGMLPGSVNGYAFAASDDGLVIGGASTSFTAIEATVWTPATGTVPLVQYLASFGVGVPSGWTPAYIYAVSGDGRTFAGEAWPGSGGGAASQGFVATIPAPPGPILLLASSLLCTRRRRGVR